MKKNLMFLAIGLLAIGSVFAAELNDSPVAKVEVAVSVQDVDFSALDYAKTEVTALPDAVKQAVTKLGEAGANLKEALVGKTAEGKSVFKLMLEGNNGASEVYLDEAGNILQTGKKEQVVEEVEEEIEVE